MSNVVNNNKNVFAGRPSKDPLHPDYAPSQKLGYGYHTDRDLEKISVNEVSEQKVLRHRRYTVRIKALKSQENSPVIAEVANCQGRDQCFDDETDKASQTNIFITARKFLVERGQQTDIYACHMSCVEAEVVHLRTANASLSNELFTLSKITEQKEQQLNACRDEVSFLQKKCVSLEKENNSLKKTIKEKCFSFDFIKGNDSRTKYYTGLPNFLTFLTLFQHIYPYVERLPKKLLPQEEFLCVLTKLRHNLGVEDLAYRFNVNSSTISKLFHVWLDAMYTHLGGLVLWPQSDFMELPESFCNDHFKKTKVIIDCTEIFIERPTSLKARSQTYSNYKSHNTAKILVGISPSGAVTFLSKAWGGRASDNKITKESGILNKLNPGDIVLADRGFTLTDELALRGCKLIVPAFTKGKKQLSAKEVEESRLLARVRIHVERVINRVKDFKILSGTLPITLVKKNKGDDLATIDKIVATVGGIVNLSPPILK